MNVYKIAMAVLGFVVGVFVSAFLDFGFSFGALWVLVSGTLFVATFIRNDLNRTFLFLVSLFLFGFGLGILRSEIFIDSVERAKFDLSSVSDKKVVARVLVDDEPQTTNSGGQKITATILNIKVEGENEKTLSANYRTLVFVRTSYPVYKYGDTLEVTGTFSSPEPVIGDDGRIFDYPTYLYKDGIYLLMYYPKINVGASDGGSRIQTQAFALKNKFVSAIGRLVPEPSASYLDGVVIGAKQSMGKDLLDQFKRVGLSHVVVLSGYNMTVIASSLLVVLAFLPRSISILASVLSLLFFVLMTGSGASSVRAAIMALVALLARATGRVYDATAALILAGFIMIVYNPASLVFDLSFQLSFLATLGIIFVSPIVEKYFSWAPSHFGIREAATNSVAAQVLVLPLIVYQMGQLSVISLIANVLVVPLIPVTMFFGFVTGGLGMFSFYLAFVPALISQALAVVELWIVSVLSSFSFASVNLPPFSAVILYIVYASVVVLLVFLNSAEKENVPKN
ncbi:MAG: ComEC/Rec2 family competence protein [Candidatus Paceibacterota bacterium]|jgi:competence protein ComEC